MTTTPTKPYQSALPRMTGDVPQGKIELIKMRSAQERRRMPTGKTQEEREDNEIQRHLKSGSDLIDAKNYQAADAEYSKAILMMEQQSKKKPLLKGEDGKSALDFSLLHPDLDTGYVNRGLAREMMGLSEKDPTKQRLMLQAAIRDYETTIKMNSTPSYVEYAQKHIGDINEFIAALPPTAPKSHPKL